MKQYYFVICILLLFIILNIKESFAYKNCNLVIEPKNVTTKNLSEYVKENISRDINYFCSYDDCYLVKEKNINISISNFEENYFKRLNEDDRLILNVKGIAITKIVLY